MVEISIMIEGQQGLTWPRWQKLAETVEELGFAGLFRSDHFTDSEPPDRAALEAVISLAYLAGNTRRIHFGPLVAPVSFRDPIQLLRQAMAIDDWSGGRMILGMGAGWQAREHSLFGYDLGDKKTRMARFEEALQVVSSLLHSDEPVSFEGNFYRLREARLLPRPARPGGLPILIGGNGVLKTLPLTAKYADIWNAVMVSPERFRELNGILNNLLLEAGRKPSDVKRTIMMAATPIESAAERIAAFADAGAEEVMLQWLALDDMDGLHALASAVI